jgi:retinaldehyde-binding protein 1
MYFHGTDMKKLHKFIDPNHLPKNYGGNLPALDYTGANWYPCVKDYEDHIAKWNTYGFAQSN